MGDPSYEYEHTEIKRVKEGEEFTEEEITVIINYRHFETINYFYIWMYRWLHFLFRLPY